MIQILKKAITVCSLVVLGGTVLYNCEPDIDTLGEQLFLGDAAQGTVDSLEVYAFNINNHDSVRSDASKLRYASLGAFTEDKFGMQKASYYTQLRPNAYNPDFGTNPVVDSVVLVIRPDYDPSNVEPTNNDAFTYKTADGDISAKMVINRYAVRKYGNDMISGSVAPFTIQVHEVTEFLKGNADIAYSNTAYATDLSKLLGSKSFDGKAKSVAITKSQDGTALFTTTVPDIRIKLDENFFKTKILAFQGKPELSDASNFIRHIKGLRISVAENDGYLMHIDPNNMEMIMYYKYEKTENGVTTKPQATYTFTLGSGNAHIGHYNYSRSTDFLNYTKYDQGGDEKLFLQGMGGPSVGIKIPESTLATLRELKNVKKAGIISAKIRLYVDNPYWKNKLPKPTFLSLARIDANKQNVENPAFIKDLTTLAGSNNFSLYKIYNQDKDYTYYEFIVTQSINDLIDGTINSADTDKTFKYFKIDMGAFLSNTSTQALIGVRSTERPYARDRVVFIGSKTTDPRKAKLVITYGTK